MPTDGPEVRPYAPRDVKGTGMQTAIVGAGPAGLFTAIALARRGHRVTLVDRDPGPPPAAPGSGAA
jgi:2-polyprenyl-6-methoxyphenol hydroxylase-like FAD-dependent oxidoreductase